MNVQRSDPGPCMSRPGPYGGFGAVYPPQARPYDSVQFDVPLKAKSFFARGQRQRLNVVPMFMCLFIPWFFFCGIYALMSFRFHYTAPVLCWVLACTALAGVLLVGAYLIFGAWRRSRGLDEPARSPSWFTFGVLSLLMAWVLAVILGDLNFSTNCQPYYDYSNLNEYSEVNPARMRGQQMMDGGRFFFTNNSAVDVRRSIGFRNLDTYCVAPISVTVPNAGTIVPLESYDFWAVGLDCCSSSAADFHCGDFANPSAHNGLRLLRDDQRAFFRLAVQQAEAAHSIKATHPLFVYWTRDANAEMASFHDEGMKYYLIGMLCHFGWQMLSVGLAAAAFSRIRGF